MSIILTWQTTCPLFPVRLQDLFFDGLYVPYYMLDYMSVIPWQTTYPLLHVRLHDPYSLIDYM